MWSLRLNFTSVIAHYAKQSIVTIFDSAEFIFHSNTPNLTKCPFCDSIIAHFTKIYKGFCLFYGSNIKNINLTYSKNGGISGNIA